MSADRYLVRYYDAKRGGVWTRTFADRAEAEAFAATRRLYARPCKVETVGADVAGMGRDELVDGLAAVAMVARRDDSDDELRARLVGALREQAGRVLP